MVFLPTIAASFVFLLQGSTPDDGWWKASAQGKDLGTRIDSAKDLSPAARAKRDREGGAGSIGRGHTRKAQFAGSGPASRGRAAPQDDSAIPASAATPAAGFIDAASAAERRASYLCPAGMVMIGHKYCVDIYEASLVEIFTDGTEKDWSPFDPPQKGHVLRAVSRAGVSPQGYISGVQAKAACIQSGKRLCQPDEWKKACMGPKEAMWGYGAEHVDNKCNDHGISSMHFFNKGLTDKPEDAWKWGANGNMMDPRLNQLEGGLAKTGEHPGCTNEYGVFDMVGNLHEWVDDPWGTFQGGYYLDTHLNADGCYYRTTAHDMKHADYSTGFRCCADVEDL
jgi:hypothetical protein